jgi:anti-sigma regulatory factor (Ser/Thr protein kinase)
VTTVITVPPSLDDATFEQLLDPLSRLQPDDKILLDARHARWASPYGLTGMLTIGQTRLTRASLAVPETDETASYWARTGFFKHAAESFDIVGSVPRGRQQESSVLLEITPVVGSDDVHDVVEKVQQKAHAILVNELKLDAAATMRFTMALSETCQNIVEHAYTGMTPRGGWVAVQTYKWSKRLGRRVVVIAVCDAGMGFRQSLESLPGRTRSDRWDDGMALEEAVMRGVSRFRDSGRGQGLAGVRRFIGKWDGKFSVRSGTARIAIVPSWDEDVPLREGLSAFPGSQIQITIPERVVR